MSRWGKLIGLLTGLLNRVICIVLGLFLLALVARPDFFASSHTEGGRCLAIDFLLEYKTVFALAALLVIILNLNILQFVIFSVWNTDVRRYISSKTSHGTARVSLDAVERSLIMAAKQLPEIEKTRLRVYRIGAKRYKVEVRFWIPENCNALNINEKLRLILKKRFSELVSVEPDEKVFFEINLAGFKRQRRMSGALPSGPPRDAIDPSRRHFKGPVYPIDGEST